MASGQKLSIRAYSFSLRKQYSRRPDKVYGLNGELRFPYKDINGEEREYIYQDSMKLFRDFLDHHEEIVDKTDNQQLFSCRFEEEGRAESFRYMIFSVFSGYYGYASRVIDRTTKNVVYRKTRNQADMRRFYVTIVIPFDRRTAAAKRGLIFFQETGVYGVKTVTASAIQKYVSVKLNVTFRTQNLAPDFYLEKIFEQGMLQKIRVARNSRSADLADRLYAAGFGREERTFVPLRVTKELKKKLKHISESDYNFFTFDGIEYPDVKMEVKIGDRVRTVDLHGLEDLSVEEALPPELLKADGTIPVEEFRERMLTVSREYLEHLPTNYG